MNLKNILYLTYDGLTDTLGQSQIIPYLVGLSKQGFCISIISFEKADKLDQHKQLIQTILDTASITWYPIIFKTSPPFISTILNLRRLNALIKLILQTRTIQLIHCRSYLTTMVALNFKTSSRALLFDIRGFWVDERIDGGIWNIQTSVYRYIYTLLKRLEKVLFNKANHIISLTHLGKQIIQNTFFESEQAKQEHPITVIPCCVDTEVFNKANLSPLKLQEYRTSLSIKTDDIVISYLGSIGTWYMLDEMLLFYKTLLVKYPLAKFLFITQDNPSVVTTKASELGIPAQQIVVVSAQRAEVPYLLSLSSASLFFITPTFSKKASSPTKQGEIMSLGIPIICNDGVGDTGQIIKESACGILLETLTVSSFEKAVENFDQLLQIPPEKIRTIALQKFSLENGVESYSNVYKQIEKLLI